jgi:hypothetical protein
MNHDDEPASIPSGILHKVLRVIVNIILAVASFKRATTSAASDDRACLTGYEPNFRCRAFELFYAPIDLAVLPSRLAAFLCSS